MATKGIKNNLPVIVYIHGGSNKAGWAYEPNYHGHNIANKGFILISIPYRLGVFGFFLILILKAQSCFI